MKHFELTSKTKVNAFGVTLFRIKAKVKLKWAAKGDIGGWVEKEENIEDNGNA